MVAAAVERFVRNQVGDARPEEWDRAALQQALAVQYLITDEGFLAGQPSGESQKSLKKWLEQRQRRSDPR